MQQPTVIERSPEAGERDTLTASSSAGPRPSAYARRSLAVASLDIGRLLADRGDVPFHVRGTCMYPTIRPGDALNIQSRQAVDISVGDIAVCRHGHTYFSCHRVICKGEREGRPFIITCTDRNRGEVDAPAFDEDLLGVVTAITRNGRPVPLQPSAYPLPVNLYHNLCAAFIQTAYRLQLWWMGVFIHLVRTGPYHFMARTWLALTRSRWRYGVNVPLNATLGDGVYRRFDPDTFDLRTAWKGRRIDRWTLTLDRTGAREPDARATFERSPDHSDVWWVAESYVRMRYSGAGLDDALLRQAKAILARSSHCLRPLKSSSSHSGTN